MVYTKKNALEISKNDVGCEIPSFKYSGIL